MSVRRALLLAGFVLGCSRGLKPAPAVDATGDLLEQARARPVAARVLGKFSLTVRSEADAVSTAGAVVLDRPGRGHVAVLGPLGGPLATLQTDGGGVAVALSKGHRHYVASDAEAILRDTTGGAVGVDDLFGLFVGDLPLDDAEVADRRVLEDGLVQVVLEAPQGARVLVQLARDATPRLLQAADAEGQIQLEATYAPFAALEGTGTPEGAPPVLVPTELRLRLPPIGLDATVRMKSWTVPEPVPEVFGLAPPEGFTSAPLQDALGQWGAVAGQAGFGLLDPS